MTTTPFEPSEHVPAEGSAENDGKGSGKDGGEKRTKDPDEWRVGYRVGAKGGMTCDICHCLVREKPGDGRAHKEWHRSLQG
jgi:hypothetical protein